MAGKEVTVSSTQGLTRVVSEVVTLLETQKEATITAINLAIPHAVNLVELIKHKIKGIYQQNSFERVKDSNKTRVIFKLSLNPLDSTHPGYQPPLDASQVTEKSFSELKKPPTTMTRRPEGEKTDTPGERFVRGSDERTGDRFGDNSGDRSGETSRRPRGQRFNGRSRGGRTERRFRGRFENSRGRFENSRGRFENTGTRDADDKDMGDRPRGRAFRGGRPFRGGRGRGGRNAGGEFVRRPEPGMEKYKLVREREEFKRNDNEVYVSGTANPIFAIKNALMLFKKNGLKTVVIKASGQALPRAVRVVEEVKRKEPGLHQLNCFEKRVFKDHYKPTEEGLNDVWKERTVEGIEITLSKTILDIKHPGYQAPLPESQVTNLTVDQVEKL